MGAAERVFEIIDQVPEIIDPENPAVIDRVTGTVKFDRVSFSYDAEPVLQDISLDAARGEIIALVGPSGGGKTTLVSLITRFYDVRDGAILIDGIDIRQMRMADLLRQIALVDQETILFNDTIANNIRYGSTAASDAEVVPVLAQATARAPMRRAWVIATVIPRSLKLPVGFIPSCLSMRSATPAYVARRSRATSGVWPSG